MSWTGSLFTLGERARQTAQAVAQLVLLDGADTIVDDAKGAWPVKTGRSKAALGSRREGGRILIVDSAYGPRIISNGVRPWQALIMQPVRRFMIRDAPRRIVERALKALGVHRG